MRAGRIPLNTIIAIEIVAVLALIGLLFALIPLLREEGPSATAARPGPPAGAPRRAGLPAAAAPESPASPAAGSIPRLRSSRLLSGARAVPPSHADIPAAAGTTVKIEPARELKWKTRREKPPAPPEAPGGGAAAM